MTDAPSLGRRAVLGSAAWSVPVVVLLASSPAYAVSGPQRVSVTVWRPSLLAGEVSGIQVDVRAQDGRPAPGAPVALSVSGIPAFFDEAVGATDSHGSFSTIMRVRTTCDPGAGLVTASVGGTSGMGSFSVVSRGVIRHSADASSTAVVALPHGSQDAIVAPENRGMPHSDPQPTGRWVRAGDVLTVVVDASPSWWLELAIGSRGPMAVFDSDGSAELSRTVLHGGMNTITADRSGLVFIVNHSEWSAVAVTISGGSPSPVWVDGFTDRTEFDRQMSDWSDAPIVTHVADRVFADVQRRVIDASDVAAVYDPAAMTSRLDEIRLLTDGVYGLSYDAVGVARKNPGRIYIAGPDSGGAYAFATTQWLSLHVSSGASKALVTGSDLWVLWHEMGHTYQTPDYTWSGLGEVTVNISSLAVQKRMTGENMLDKSPDIQDRIARYFAQPVADRDFGALTTESPFFPLLLFDQLRRSFGDDFYPALSQYYRVRRAKGIARPQSDRQKIDAFATAASTVSERDLGPFFQAWGLTVSDDVLAEVAGFPALTHDIWTYALSTDAPIEREVAYNPPTGSLTSGATSVYLGDAMASVSVSDTRSISGAPSRVVARGVVASQIGQGAGRVFAVLQSPEGTQEVLQRTVAVTAVSALEFVGFYDVMIGTIAISADGSHLVATSLGNQAHPIYFAGRMYYSVELRAADGTVRASASVRGEDTGEAMVAQLDGQLCQDGDVLVVRAAEPSRVRLYQDSVQTTTLSSDPQVVTIQKGRFAL